MQVIYRQKVMQEIEELIAIYGDDRVLIAAYIARNARPLSIHS